MAAASFDDPDNRTNNVEPAIYNLGKAISTSQFQWYFGYVFNTWIVLSYCPECVDADGYNYLPNDRMGDYYDTPTTVIYTWDTAYVIDHRWLGVYMAVSLFLLIISVASITLESRTVAPDTLGYISIAARNSKYLHLPQYTSQMSGPERAQQIGQTMVMMQDVKANAETGRIVLGNKYDGAAPLKPGRVYR